jgi:hypothetical protein
MKTKELQLVSFDQAKRLKDAGFDWECNIVWAFYDNEIARSNEPVKNNLFHLTVPTVALALKWLRDVRGIHGDILYDHIAHGHYYRWAAGGGVWRISINKKGEGRGTCEAAESALLDELLKLAARKR